MGRLQEKMLCKRTTIACAEGKLKDDGANSVDIVILFEVRNRTDSLRVGRHIWIWKC